MDALGRLDCEEPMGVFHMPEPHGLYLSFDGYGGWFHILAIVNSVINNYVEISLCYAETPGI